MSYSYKAENLLSILNDSKKGIIKIDLDDVLAAIELENAEEIKVISKDNNWYIYKTI